MGGWTEAGGNWGWLMSLARPLRERRVESRGAVTVVAR